jgi:DNA repair protein RadC
MSTATTSDDLVTTAPGLPLHETPAYRVRANIAACNTIELLAALIGGPHATRTAERLLAHSHSVFALSRAHSTELLQVYGIGPQSAARLCAAFELARRAQADECDPVVRSPADAAQWLMPRLAHREQEHFAVLLLNARNRIMGEPVELYRGSVNTAQVRVSEVFRDAIRLNASGLIACHNHPSGDPSPSPEDVMITKAIIEAAGCWASK